MRKIIPLFLCVALFMSLAPQISFASESLSDGVVESTLLYELGVTDFRDPGEFFVTRSDFTRYAMKLANIPVTPHVGTVFEDVDSSNPDYNYIMSAVDFGLISKAATYRPNDYVTLNEMTKIMIKLLGYDYIAEERGGYPYGYLQTAHSIDLLDGISYANEQLTQADAAIVLCNALHIELPEISYTADGVNQYVTGSSTILSQYRNMTFVNGMVDGVAAYATSDEQGLGEGKMSIDGVVYNSGTIDTATLFGCNVDAYVDNATNTVVVCHITDHTKLLSIYAEDIISYSGYKFTYEDAVGKEKTVSIGHGTCVFYNGRVFDYDSSKLIPDSGSITFVSSGSGEVTALYIKSYKTVVVDRIMKSEYKIIDKYSPDNSLVLDPDEMEYTIITQDGEALEFSSIQQGDVLCAAVSDDKAYAEIICVRDKFIGTYSGYSDDYIHIDGTEYKLTPAIKAKISSVLTLGKEAVFSLDADDRVADVAMTGLSSGNIGYLFWGRYQENGMNKIMAARILGLDGKTHFYEFADVFTINGKGYKNFEKAWLEHKSPDYNSLLCGMVVYSLDAKGELKSIDYSDEDGGNSGLYVTQTVEEADEYHTYQQYFGNVGNDIICDTTLKIFKVPGPLWSVDNIDEEKYTVEDPSYIADNGKSQGYKLVGYTTNEGDAMTQYLLMQKLTDDDSGESDSFNGNAYMVNAVRKLIIDDEPREVMELCGYGRGVDAPLVVYSKEENSFTEGGIGGGDLVQINRLENNVVKSFKVVYKNGADKFVDGSERLAGSARVPSLDISMAYIYSLRGRVANVVSPSRFSEPVDPSNIKAINLTTPDIFKYDNKLGRVVSVGADELRDYEAFGDEKSMIIYNRTYYNLNTMFVIK